MWRVAERVTFRTVREMWANVFSFLRIVIDLNVRWVDGFGFKLLIRKHLSVVFEFLSSASNWQGVCSSLTALKGFFVG
jgi:hypothetical protein